MDAILKRRSIRKFLDQPIPEEALEKILRAGMAAPSAGGSAEWEFVLFADPKKKEALMEVSEYAFPVKTAPVCMVVCGNLDREIHKDRGWWVQDCSAAMENMLLEATDLGIGSIWLGIYPYEERVAAVRSLFSLPERVMPLGIMALGYAAKEKPANDRYLADRVHWEQFGAAYTGQAGGPAVL